MLGATTLRKNSAKSKGFYTSYRIALGGASSCKFADHFSRTVMILGIDNSSSCHADNCENNLSLLSGGQINDIDESFRAAEKEVYY